MKQRSDEWFKARVGVITASRVPGILGSSPYQDRDDVMRLMVREALGLEQDPVTPWAQRAMDWGTEMEDTARRAFEIETGELVHEVGMILHPMHRWLGASPDGLIGGNEKIAPIGLEIKCPFSKKLFSIMDRPDYMDQVQHQMKCCMSESSYFVVWTPDDMFIEEVMRDDGWWEKNKDAISEFHNEFVQVMADEAKQKRYREPKVKERDDAVWQTAVTAWLDAKEDKEQAEKKEKAYREALIRLADDRSTKGCGVAVTLKSGASRTDYRRIVEDNKDLLKEVDLGKYVTRGNPVWDIRGGKK